MRGRYGSQRWRR